MIGVLMGFADDGAPLVVYPGNPTEAAPPARTTAASDPGRCRPRGGAAVRGWRPGPAAGGRAAGPAGGGCRSPSPATVPRTSLSSPPSARLVLRCGKASITLTRAGKVLIRGEYIFSRSTGVNKMKGGSIQLN